MVEMIVPRAASRCTSDDLYNPETGSVLVLCVYVVQQILPVTYCALHTAILELHCSLHRVCPHGLASPPPPKLAGKQMRQMRQGGSHAPGRQASSRHLSRGTLRQSHPQGRSVDMKLLGYTEGAPGTEDLIVPGTGFLPMLLTFLGGDDRK